MRRAAELGTQRGDPSLDLMPRASNSPSGCDCYPYAASSTTIDPAIVDEGFKIQITWSDAHPQMAGKTLREIAELWQVPQVEAARRLEPGARSITKWRSATCSASSPTRRP